MKSLFKVTLLATTMAVALHAPITFAAEAAKPATTADSKAAFKNDDQKSAYALGASLGRYMENSLKEQEKLGIKLDKDQLIAGVQDAFADKSKLSDQEIEQTLQAFEARVKSSAQAKMEKDAADNEAKGKEYREKFAKAWGVESLPAHTGYRISELPHRVAHGEVRAAYIMGEDPLQTDAELSAVRKAFEDLELVIVQDIFMTKTASAADVILPSTSWGEHEGVFTAADRGFQRFFKAVEPKWDLKTDWQIISEIATRMGYPMHYNNTQEIWDELRHLCPDFYGATYEKMGELGFIQWPCRDTSDADQGTSYLFKEKFDTPNGLAQFFTCDWVAPIDKLTDEYPMVLSTVREVGHYSCRSMTGNCAALAALADEPGYAQINTEDAKRLGIEDEALVWVHSRKGKIITRAQVSDRPNKGAIYMTYQWWIGACNELVTENLSPITKTPEYKYCAVRVEPIADQRAAEQYVIDEYNKLKTRLREAALA